MKYTVIKVERQVTKTQGKPVTKLELKADGANHTEPRVTFWPDTLGLEELYETIKVGDIVAGVIEKKDSGTPITGIPNATGNYVWRTLKAETNENGTLSVPNVDINFQTSVIDRLKALEAKVFGNDETPAVTEDGTVEINPEDIPF